MSPTPEEIAAMRRQMLLAAQQGQQGAPPQGPPMPQGPMPPGPMMGQMGPPPPGSMPTAPATQPPPTGPAVPQAAPPNPQGGNVPPPGVTQGQGGQMLYNGTPISQETLAYLRSKGNLQ